MTEQADRIALSQGAVAVEGEAHLWRPERNREADDQTWQQQQQPALSASTDPISSSRLDPLLQAGTSAADLKLPGALHAAHAQHREAADAQEAQDSSMQAPARASVIQQADGAAAASLAASEGRDSSSHSASRLLHAPACT